VKRFLVKSCPPEKELVVYGTGSRAEVTWVSVSTVALLSVCLLRDGRCRWHGVHMGDLCRSDHIGYDYPPTEIELRY
jgi:hypothetical protein